MQSRVEGLKSAATSRSQGNRGYRLRDFAGKQCCRFVASLTDELAARGTFFESAVSALKSLSVHILL